MKHVKLSLLTVIGRPLRLYYNDPPLELDDQSDGRAALVDNLSIFDVTSENLNQVQRAGHSEKLK